MTEITITEALAELKTLGKRVEKRREFVRAYLLRQDNMRDPLEKDGGSVAALREARQAIKDLEWRAVAIRMAIAKANAETEVTVDGETRTVAEWLVWRREIADGAGQFINGLNKMIQKVREEARQKGVEFRHAEDAARSDADVVVNLNERELANQIEHHEEILGALDGQLSLKNATVVIDV